MQLELEVFMLVLAFACDLGFSISRLGYSPMIFSPFTKRRREKCGAIPTYIIYEQYTRHKKQ